MPERRVFIVLSSLVGAMTLASTLLLALEPTGSVGVPLQQINRSGNPAARLFATQKPIDRRWTRIIIHDSGTLQGAVTDLAAAHRQIGLDGAGYHFVIDNGAGDDNGQSDIHATARWISQRDGAFLNAVDPHHRDQPQAIGICLIGDTRREPAGKMQLQQLAWLVQQLQGRLNIPASQVAQQTSGEQFASAWLQGQLLAPASP